MKLIASGPISGTAFLEPIPAGLYEAFEIYLTGTENMGQNFTANEVGTVRVLINGIDYVNANFQDLQEYARLHGGSIRSSAPGGGTFEHNLPMPRGFRDGNVELITDSDQAQISIHWGANLATIVASGTVEVYGHFRKTGTQLYRLKVLNISETYGGAGQFPLVYREENIIAIYPRVTIRTGATAETTLTRIQGEVDSRVLHDVAREPLRWSTYNRRNNDSGETSKLGELMFAADGQIGEYLADRLMLKITTSGALSFDSLVVAADFTPTQQAATTVLSGEVLDAAIRRKLADNKTRPVAVIESAVGIPVRR